MTHYTICKTCQQQQHMVHFFQEPAGQCVSSSSASVGTHPVCAAWPGLLMWLMWSLCCRLITDGNKLLCSRATIGLCWFLFFYTLVVLWWHSQRMNMDLTQQKCVQSQFTQIIGIIQTLPLCSLQIMCCWIFWNRCIHGFMSEVLM